MVTFESLHLNFKFHLTNPAAVTAVIQFYRLGAGHTVAFQA